MAEAHGADHRLRQPRTGVHAAGTIGPFIMRFDTGTVPVGYLVFSSASRSLGEIQDLALDGCGRSLRPSTA